MAKLRDFGEQSWRSLSRPSLGLANAISDHIAGDGSVSEECVGILRASPSLLLLSDYGGAHKGATHEVLSFLFPAPSKVELFNASRSRIRNDVLGTERRISYKSLGDKVRRRALPRFLDSADQLSGLLVSFAIDRRAGWRFSEEHNPTALMTSSVSKWANRSFRKLTRIGNLAAILVEGVRADHQNLLWISDEDEIAPNHAKHSEAVRLLGHYLNHYCSGPMGHFRFGTTASDAGDRLIEDLAAVPDLAAGCLGEMLSFLAPHPQSRSVERLLVPSDPNLPYKVAEIAKWLSGSTGSLQKICIAIDEYTDGCSIRTFQVVTRLENL